jgi:replicative DNA helicase
MTITAAQVETETATLGALIAWGGDAWERAEAIRSEYFADPVHRRIWDAIAGRYAKGQTARPEFIAQDMVEDSGLNELGGIRYLADLLDRAPPAFSVTEYADALADAYLRRSLVELGGALAKVGSDPTPANVILAEAEAHVFGLAETRDAEGGFVTFASAADNALEVAAAAYQRQGGLAGISTGLVDLDAKLGGLVPSDLLILAGRPSMGKTALATNIATAVAKAYQWEPQPDGTRKTVAGGVVGFYSLEMSAEQLAGRILADMAGISGDRIRKGQIDSFEFGRLRDAKEQFNALPLHIDATGGIPLAKLASRARRFKRKHGLDLLIVDYLQLVTHNTGSRDGNRVQEVSAITAGLKALAKELNVPVIALSQLSRQVESRQDKRPMLSDLRESGSIEQDADVVAFVYRESYYVEREEPPKNDDEKHLAWQERMDLIAGKAEVIIGKARHGPIGTVQLSFEDDFTRFGNLAREGRYEVR